MKLRLLDGSRGRFIAALSSLALVLAGCGGSASSDFASFKPPDGWKEFSMFGYSMWVAPDNQGGQDQTLMVMRLPNRKDGAPASFTMHYHDDVVEQRKTITICGNQPATYLELIGSKPGKREDVEMVQTQYAGVGYVALYSRDAGAPINSDASAAIKSLCLKK